jgi:DedD protein
VERHVKERLIGAVVLIAAAVILIPEMLSGPDRSSRSEPSTTRNEGSLKTYTIDLSKTPTTPGAGVSEEIVSDEAPPPEVQPTQTLPPSQAQAIPESASHAQPPLTEPAADTPQTPTVRAAAPPAAARPESPPVESKPQSTPHREPASNIPRPTSEGWAVQLGSFASQGTADGMTRKLRAEGYDAFVMPVKSGATTLYRVRVGPMKDRESAATVLARIKTGVPAATLVKHP